MAADLKRRSALALIAGLVLAACATVPTPAPAIDPAAEDAVITLYLVRHGEKEAGDDPDLSPAGKARAEALARRLDGADLTEIWSTQTKRTQQTAAPVVRQTGLPVQPYDASTLPAFASWLLDTPGVKLVVGHSNTTDALAALLGADPGPPIDDKTEFDRLYVIYIDKNGIVRSSIGRYGAPSAGAE
jgi:phosphohistidine phosphatase SixA